MVTGVEQDTSCFPTEMYVLIIDGFEESPKGLHGYKNFKELVVSTFARCDVPDCSFLERRLNRLGDLVVDWEHDSLNDVSRENCKHFDKIDFVFISGDMKICPWEPVATQVVTLIHMCKFMKKPLFCSGFGAFTAIYTLATKGARFHVLNGPEGEEIEHLSAFPRYSIGTGAFPSGWYDNETGDLYTYNRKTKHWDPVCNLGIYRIAANGTPSSNRHAPLAKKYARDDHTLDVHQVIETLDVDATVVRIRNVHIQHYAMKGFEAQNFTSKEYPHWYIRTDGSLPSGESLFVVADGEKGAVVLSKDRMLLMTSKVDKSVSYASCRRIVTNFVTHIMKQIKLANRDKLEDSMLEFLFGADGVSGGTYDSMLARMPMSAPLSRTSVPTALPQGPVKVDPPAIGMFIYTPKQDNVDYLALTANRRSSTIGRTPNLRIQNPLHAKQKRLENLSARVGGINVTSVAEKSLAIGKQIDPNQDEEGVPEQVKELFAGIIMNTKSVSKRRSPRSSPMRDLSAQSDDTAEQAPDNEWDKEAGDYQLERFVRPFGESLVVPGSSRGMKVGSTKIGSSYNPAAPLLDGNESINSDDIKGVTFSEDAVMTAPSDSMISTITSNNVPFMSFPPAARASAATSPRTPQSSFRPQQPRTPQSSASACRMASKINREFRERAGTANSNTFHGTTTGQRPFTSPSATEDPDDSSEDESGGFSTQQAPPLQPSLVSGLSVESVGANGWSNVLGATKVPPIQNWSRVLQQGFDQGQESPFTTSLDSAPSKTNQRKFFPYTSHLTGSQTQRDNSSLLAQTVSSLQRATLSASIGPLRATPPVAAPQPHTARTPSDINTTLRSLHLPVRRPAGPVHRRRVNTASLEPELAEEWMEDGQSFVYLSESNDDALRDESIINDGSRYSTFKQYQSDTVPQVVLPTTPAERPYSSYAKITQQLARKKKSEDRNYPGACVRPFLHPEEVARKEFMQSKRKFLAGQFKTSFGPGKSSLEIRKEGFLRAEGQYPLHPPQPLSARPDNTTAIHFTTLQRSRQPTLAGDWK